MLGFNFKKNFRKSDCSNSIDHVFVCPNCGRMHFPSKMMIGKHMRCSCGTLYRVEYNTYTESHYTDCMNLDEETVTANYINLHVETDARKVTQEFKSEGIEIPFIDGYTDDNILLTPSDIIHEPTVSFRHKVDMERFLKKLIKNDQRKARKICSIRYSWASFYNFTFDCFDFENNKQLLDKFEKKLARFA